MENPKIQDGLGELGVLFSIPRVCEGMCTPSVLLTQLSVPVEEL